MRFLIGEKDLEGTNAERRVKEVVGMGRAATTVYPLKDTTYRLNSNAKRYTEEQKAFIAEECKDMIHFFGYANVEKDPDNYTGFFDYPGEQDSELLSQYKGYQSLNEASIDWVCSSDE